MTKPQELLYTSKIIKAGALLSDTRVLLANWDETNSVAENLNRFRTENLLGKTSRSRVKDVLAIFRQRYFTDLSVSKALIRFANSKVPMETLNRILYFHAAQSDRLLYDIVVELLFPMYQLSRQDVATNDVKIWINQKISQGRTHGQWSDSTITRSAREALATLRDFGIIQGAVKKHLAPVYLPLEAFAYIAFYLKQGQPSGQKLLHDSNWQLFFLADKAVEHFFIEAHQHRLLEYQAAGSIIRIDFPAESLEEYACIITQRAH